MGCQFAHTLDDRKEHFGFVDGISQPAIEGFRVGHPGDGKLSARGWQSLPVGEFIIGYPDEGLGPAERLDAAPRAKDGTFLVYRKLEQDVEAFLKASESMAAASTMSQKEVEEKMMGRHHDGAPLNVPPGSQDPPKEKSLWNDFTYANDPDGSQCPFGSHVRRSNPRDSLHFEGRRVNRHRIIRRGMTYGDSYLEGEPGGKKRRGLIFVAFNARFEDQFEFIQKNWLNGGRTFRLGDDADPIAGTGDGESIRIVINGEKPVLHTQPKPFTTFRGGDYFFVPSISMLNEIAFGK
jgi:Dyp-type peroxidase family